MTVRMLSLWSGLPVIKIVEIVEIVEVVKVVHSDKSPV